MTEDEEIALVGGNGTGASPHTGATYAVPRLGLRAVYFSDGPVGPRQGAATAMPIPMALAATWNPSLAFGHGREIATEAKAKGNDFVFAPTVNIMRTPQGGRTYEAYGEDAYLVAQTTVGWIRGAQSTGVIATVKHFVANNQEGQNGVPPVVAVNGGRQVVDARVDERTLREVYFPQFEAAVKQGRAGALMCSYNRVNGAYACENPHTLLQVLRGGWGYKGIILSDYGAAKDTAGDMNNGLDFVPAEGETDFAYQPQAIQLALATGQVSRATLERHVRNILRTLFAYGVFDRAGYLNEDGQINAPADRTAAEQIEERAITLLKNNGALPLRPGVKRIAVIGPYANRFVTGGGSGGVTPLHVVTVLQGIIARAGKHVTVTYADGTDQTAAAATARAADVAVVVVGDVETEGQDKSCVDLNCSSDAANSESVLATSGSSCGPQPCPLNGTDQDGLISAVAAAQKHTVVVLETGAPVLTPWRGQVPGIVEAWYPGQEGGTAVARILFGDADPAGRLPATFPADPSQLPTAGDPRKYPGVAEEEDYSEGVFVGYKWYDAHNLTPAFPFGYGLSYTRFRYGPLTVRAARAGNQVATATIDITNTGRRSGSAVPELYLGKPAAGALPQPVRQLVGYASVPVAPGRTVAVTFPLDDRSFASWDGDRWRVLAGCYRLSAGPSSRALTSQAVVARGAVCAGAGAALPASRDFALPVPAAATAKLLAGRAALPARRLALAVSPTRVAAGARTRLAFTVTERTGRRSTPASGAVVHIAGQRVGTGRDGRADLTIEFSAAGSFRVTATKSGWPAAAALVRAAVPGSRFTG